MTWKNLFGEPVVIISVVLAIVNAVDWTQIHVTWVQIVVSGLTGGLGVLLARAKVTPTAKANAIIDAVIAQKRAT